MGGVDRHDQIRLQRYSIQKAMRFAMYYKSLFLAVVDMAIVNGFIVHRFAKKEKGEQPPKHGEYIERLQQEILALESIDFEHNLFAENLVSAPVSSNPHSLVETEDLYQNKRRQYLCKVCSAFSDREKRSFETYFYCKACTIAFGGRVALCNKIRPGQTIACTRVWHETWKDGTLIPSDLRKRIRFRKRKRLDGRDEEEKED